jgi:hypothetical protein
VSTRRLRHCGVIESPRSRRVRCATSRGRTC